MTDPSRRPCRGPQDAAQRVVFPPRSPRQTPTRPPPRKTCGGRWSRQARRRRWCASRAAGDAKRQVESVPSRRLTTPRDSPPPCATRRATRHRGCRRSPTLAAGGGRREAGAPTRCHAEIELDLPQQLDEIVAAPRGSNPRRPSRQPRRASNPRGDTSRDTSLSSSLSPADPTSTRSNSSIALDGADGHTDSPEQTRERRAPRLRSGASRSPPRACFKALQGVVHFSAGASWSISQPALTRGEGLPDEALRAATRSAPRSSRSRLHREGGSIFERRKGVNFRAALTISPHYDRGDASSHLRLVSTSRTWPASRMLSAV